MRRLQVGKASVVVGTSGRSVRPVFGERPGARPVLIGHVVRDYDCNCRRPHRWRAIPAASLELYRYLEAEWDRNRSQAGSVALETVGGQRFRSIRAGVRALATRPWPADD